MLTDKQSLILCAIVVFGFSISGMIGILDNYVIVAVLVILFLLIIINIFIQKPDEEYNEEILDGEVKKSNPNIINNDNI
ncbi:hypothetical protein [Formosa maritima]|uniref:Uncharacterized protein n=1 Tax=Formosa maritima TaxID=2592046 RepID=A0A5D0GAL3_9FLAO|nr:hypothetical protein [Formosa maritima]TYA55986.1 hypothetical protein FVF61_06795 [Formosa maritima]